MLPHMWTRSTASPLPVAVCYPENALFGQPNIGSHRRCRNGSKPCLSETFVQPVILFQFTKIAGWRTDSGMFTVRHVQRCVPIRIPDGLSPSKMISALRAGMFEKVIKTDMVWMCVSCYACTRFCPAKIPLTPGLMTRAKEELLLAGNVPVELQDALQNTQRYGNSMGESPRKRATWIQAIDPPVTIMSQANRPVDVLWFVGDYGSFHPRVQQTSQALARIFNALGVDFGILGPEENSDGDSQRLAGERGLFEMLAEKNGRVFQKYHFNEIVTADPHAYNALKNEYPALGISYPVRHYTQYLAEKLKVLRPLLKHEVKARVTYHDPCYLGRANGIYDEPRALLNLIPGVELVEMSHHGVDSLCCGGGGWWHVAGRVPMGTSACSPVGMAGA